MNKARDGLYGVMWLEKWYMTANDVWFGIGQRYRNLQKNAWVFLEGG